jgi:hypothetical protein
MEDNKYCEFNLNERILVQINENGWKLLRDKEFVGQSYIDACILPNKVVIDNKEYYSLQAWEVADLFDFSIGFSCGINSNILIEKK